jgi:beta-lactamase class D
MKEELNIKDSVDNYKKDWTAGAQRMGLQEYLNRFKYINTL